MRRNGSTVAFLLSFYSDQIKSKPGRWNLRAENFSIKYRDPKISVFSHSAGPPITEMLRFALLLVSLGLGAPHPAREGRVIDSGSGKDFHIILGLY